MRCLCSCKASRYNVPTSLRNIKSGIMKLPEPILQTIAKQDVCEQPCGDSISWFVCLPQFKHDHRLSIWHRHALDTGAEAIFGRRLALPQQPDLYLEPKRLRCLPGANADVNTGDHVLDLVRVTTISSTPPNCPQHWLDTLKPSRHIRSTPWNRSHHWLDFPKPLPP